ncbi:MAG: heavy-metal-associated domain-containing protein [Oligella ureolytica]|nr:heavy-metal-associated domain-containing protein [Oligella ureolytica]
MTKVVFNMEPFTCPSCVKKIESAVSRTNGVEEVRVMFNSGRVRATFDESKVAVDEIQGIIEKLGYSVQSHKVS